MQVNKTIEVEQLIERFTNSHGSPPDVIVRSPGRVNLIGDHTDYNEGLALPIATPQAVFVAARRTDSRSVVVSSDLDSATVHFELARLNRDKRGWEAYVQGVTHELAESGVALAGWEGMILSDLPVGAGLASSAALELAVARVFIALSGEAWDPTVMVKVCQRAENHWVGVDSGLLDQMSSALCRQGMAMLIDFSSLEVTHVRLPPDVTVLILDTGTRRQLVDSEYNARRRECHEIAEVLGLATLRQLDESQLPTLDPLLRRRARHVMTENAAVEGVVEALGAEDLAQAGTLLSASHSSLRDDYEVSTSELDAMVEALQPIEGVYGARMTGGGFGGSVVALIQQTESDAAAARALDRYRSATGLVGSALTVEPSAGTGIVWSI